MYSGFYKASEILGDSLKITPYASVIASTHGGNRITAESIGLTAAANAHLFDTVQPMYLNSLSGTMTQPLINAAGNINVFASGVNKSGSVTGKLTVSAPAVDTPSESEGEPEEE